ncbi:MAG TPA: hypothetical protein VLQ93_00645, partial [Myxococcaceae bacterium]|nr:hypothetical protein [Myxococcaceae bacterium]
MGWLVLGTIVLGLLLDTRGPEWGQAAASVLSWLALAWVLRRSSGVERRRLALCVVIATLGECFLSLVWGLYEYRLYNIPLFVPPGHALLFAWGVEAARTAPRWLPRATLVLVGALVALGAVTGSDTEAMMWFTVLAGFLVLGRRRRLYATMFLLATTLELAGTGLGAWWWHPEVPWLGLTSWNPALCAGVFYCILDVLVLKTAK